MRLQPSSAAVAHDAFHCMGTRCHVILPGLSQDEATALFTVIRSELDRIERHLSWFDRDSAVSRLNREAAWGAVAVDEELFALLQTCKAMHERTHGYFDVTWRSLAGGIAAGGVDATGRKATGRKTGGVEASGADAGMRLLELDREGGKVRFGSDRLSIDFGGVGKGYALDRIHDRMRRYGVEQLFISLGESSVLTIGHHPAGDHWPIGIRNPFSPEETAHTFRIRTGSVSTSGTFRVDPDGQAVTHPHILDPLTGRPVAHIATASVAGPNAAEAEMWSTALLAMPPALRTRLAATEPGLDMVIVDYQDGRPHPTPLSHEASDTPGAFFAKAI